MKKIADVCLLCLSLIVLTRGRLDAQVNVTTWHNDNWRTGQNTSETHLTTGSFSNNGFGLLCKIALPPSPQQEQVYAQPLVIANSDGSMTVYVTTMQDNIYSFNVPPRASLTGQTCAQLQTTTPISLLRGPLQGQFPADACFVGNGTTDSTCSARVICPSVGAPGTPAIDTTSNTLYLVTESQDKDTSPQGQNCGTKAKPTTWYHYLHALDLTSAVASLIPSRAQEASAAGQAASNGEQSPTTNWAAGNPLKIGLLKWYQANTTTSFVVGKTENSNPYGVAFDGANIWTANSGEGTVTKLRTSDGAVLGTFTVGGQPNGVVFDGANIWVTISPNTVSKLRAIDGKDLGSFKVGGAPWWPAFDGTNIWVPTNDAVTKLRASDGKNLGTFKLSGAIAAAFDGTYVWVTSYGSGTVTKLTPQDGKIVGTYSVGTAPIGVAFDGANIWVANNAGGSVSKLRASDGKALGTFRVPGSPYGVAFDGANIWVTQDPGLVELRASDGAMLGAFPANPGSTGVAFDGANIWVALGLDHLVLKF
jgi:sugar lactone lactonase YvrE